MDLLLLLAMGAVAGLLAGLLGVGGGIVVVPALLLVFTHQDVPEAVRMHTAIGSSLATIIVTSVASIAAHNRHGAVDWEIFRALLPGLVVGGVAGVMVAKQLSGDSLRMGFAVFLMLVALQMLWGRSPATQRALPGRAGMHVAGGLIGAVSTLMGIGGGTLSVPFLTWCRQRLQRAVGTAAALGLPIAITGTLAYMIAGAGLAGRSAWSVGYVNLPAVGGIVLASTLVAPLGVALAHRMPAALLKQVFAVFLILVSVRLWWN